MKRSWLRLLFVIAFVFAPLSAPGTSGMVAGQGPVDPLTLPVAEPGIAPGWLVQRTDTPITFQDMSQHSMRLDSAGYPRLVYGGDHLYYAYQDAGGWHNEVADGAWSVGRGAALALDAGGKVHISYYDSVNSSLKYATNKSGAWVVQTVVSQSGSGLYSDIAIDSAGDPAIVYYDFTDETLHYIRYDSEYGAWGPNEVFATDLYNPGHTGWFSFALDTSTLPNKPHVSFYKTDSLISQDGDLFYARYSSANAWVVSFIDSCSAPEVCRTGEYNSIALDPVSKVPSVAYSYTLFGNPVLVYGVFDGTIFSFNIVNSTIPKYINLAMDTTSKGHITYQEGGFKYQRQTATGGGSWTGSETIDASSGAGEWSSLAVIGTTAHVVHYNTATGLLRFVDKDRFGWLAPYTVVTQGSKVGSCASLAVDRLGWSHTSYYDETHHILLYARYDGSDLVAKSNIDISGKASCFSVMAVNPLNNSPVVGFVKDGSLYYATYFSTTWQPPTVVDTGISLTYDAYQSFGMAMRSDGKPVFAYVKGGSLITRSWTGSGWAEAIVTSGSLGGHLSLALDGNNHSHILFTQANLLTHAFSPSISWRIEPVVDEGIYFYGAALAASPDGQLAAVFLGTGGSQLHYSERTSDCDVFTHECVWTPPALVDENCEEYFSLAVDRRGTPHAACMAWDDKGESLHYITRRGSDWIVQVVDGLSWSGRYPGLALSPSGKPRISYRDLVNYDLKFALALDIVYLPMARK